VIAISGLLNGNAEETVNFHVHLNIEKLPASLPQSISTAMFGNELSHLLHKRYQNVPAGYKDKSIPM
jgi:hypothetical protein